jgi:hypothetical protein
MKAHAHMLSGGADREVASSAAHAWSMPERTCLHVAVLKEAPSDEDALRCKAVLLVELENFEEASRFISIAGLDQKMAFEKVHPWCDRPSACLKKNTAGVCLSVWWLEEKERGGGPGGRGTANAKRHYRLWFRQFVAFAVQVGF